MRLTRTETTERDTGEDYDKHRETAGQGKTKHTVSKYCIQKQNPLDMLSYEGISSSIVVQL